MIGKTVSHYRVIALLGRGGMGVVYRARDLDLERFAALKFVPPELSQDTAAVERFTREAKAVAALSHPNICTIYEIGRHEGAPFIALELLDGQDVREALIGRPQTAATVATLGAAVADALAAAHAKGIVHRDIKPGNLFLTGSGQIKVLDFGLAKLVGAPSPDDATRAADVTAKGSALGTLPYMSPEQALGQAVDGRSDIYSLGVVLFELATGGLPFSGPTVAAALDRKLRGDLSLPSGRSTAVPPELNRIIVKALAREAVHRYQSATDLRADLLQLTGGGSASSGDRVRPSPHDTRRRRLPVVAGVAAMATVAAVAAVYLRPPKSVALTDRDPVVLGDFSNLTGDPAFEDVLRGALVVAVAQSPHLNVVPEARVQDTLRLMDRAPTERLTPEVGREVCQREQAKALLGGRIAKLGTAYTLTLDATACADGDTLATTEARATDESGVLDALGRAAAALRSALGESLATVKALDVPLARATTSSLEALRAYTLGQAARVAGDDVRAIALYRRALEIDPNFASAHAGLGTVLAGNFPVPEALPHLIRAFELRDRVSERERLAIAAAYHLNVTDDSPRRIEQLRVWRSTYPGDWTAANNLALALVRLGDTNAAAAEARDAVRLNDRHAIARRVLATVLFVDGQLDQADAVVADSIAAGLDSPLLHETAQWVAHFKGQRDAVERRLVEREPLRGRGVFVSFYFRPWYQLQQGHVADAVRTWMARIDRERVDGNRNDERLSLARLARLHALEGDVGEARKAMQLAMRLAGDGRMPPEFGLALAESGDVAGARAWIARVSADTPDSTFVHQLDVPQVLATLALRDKRPDAALAALRPVGTLDRSYTGSAVYLRTRALREAGRAQEAMAFAEPWLSRPWLLAIQGVDQLLPLEYARAAATAGERDKARSTYQQLLRSWTNADAGFSLARQARRELAALSSAR